MDDVEKGMELADAIATEVSLFGRDAVENEALVALFKAADRVSILYGVTTTRNILQKGMIGTLSRYAVLIDTVHLNMLELVNIKGLPEVAANGR